MLNLLREQNKLLIEEYTAAGNTKLVTKHTIIGMMLKDDECFSKIEIEKAYDILKSLRVKDWKDVYVKLLRK